MFGAEGLIKVLYDGELRGAYRGPHTCHVYQVEPGRSFWMDKGDASAMVGYKSADGGLLFYEVPR